MKPVKNTGHYSVWMLARLLANGNYYPQGYGCPYTLDHNNNLFTTLESAQQAQTYEALKNGAKYEIFHLEFPVNV